MASIVTEPASCPGVVLVATQLATVALPVPVTVPAPDCLAKATTVVVVGGDGVAGRVLQGRGGARVAPEVRLLVGAGEHDVGGGAVDRSVKGAEGAGGWRPAGRGGSPWSPGRLGRR